ncbi:YppG family protein [Bacillus fonticola]|uniref:YppG family protein n=1 Tax=Bacillus fonticola TaxID=2728853 RepID=UPI0014764018|nr:YppG family protein [Bacillus fonticola]
MQYTGRPSTRVTGVSGGRNSTPSQYPYGATHPFHQIQTPYQAVQGHPSWNNGGQMGNPYGSAQPVFQPMPANAMQGQWNQQYPMQQQAQWNQQYPMQQQAHYQTTPYAPNEGLYQNPLSSKKSTHNQPPPQQQPSPYLHPYPPYNQPQQANKGGGKGGLMSSFKNQEGTVDFNKMMDTAGQMMNAMNQVSGMVKGLGGMFKV